MTGAKQRMGWITVVGGLVGVEGGKVTGLDEEPALSPVPDPQQKLGDGTGAGTGVPGLVATG
ncbi:MAG: hypothetical protein WB867_09285, partial [Candidatus Dormiibacterota bacterium]